MVYRWAVASRRRPRWARTFCLSIALIVFSAGHPLAEVQAATDRLPDLRSAHITDLRIVESGSRRLLRFTGMMWNKGAGPFEIRAKRATKSAPWKVDQVVHQNDGGTRRIRTDATLRYAGDGHDHWHVRRVLSYHLWGKRGTLRDAKVGFCFFDTNRVKGSLPRSPSKAVYKESMCGRKASLKTRNGISVGWGDRYPWNFAYQWIDISGLPKGTYTIRAAVDLYQQFAEESDKNNCAWARIRFGAKGRKVTVLDRGFGCINDHATTKYAADVAWARETGVSKGCDADMFCTNDRMIRGQFAGFLARAMGLPKATADYFTDDDGTPYEANINKLAEAGILAGCSTPGRFCPKKPAKRNQVAAFLARALSLPSTDEDFFDDDTGVPFEKAINRLAAAGIAVGCGHRTYCPTEAITRGQAVEMLRRAFGETD